MKTSLRAFKATILVATLFLSSSSFSQTVVITGSAKLAGTSNHSGIEVKFSRIAPTPLTQVLSTNSDGLLSGSIPAGLYNITYTFNGYFSVYLKNVNCFTSPTLEEKILHIRETRIHVPDDFQVVQHAIDDSNQGDTILLNPGTYYENINLKGKKIMIASLFIFSQDTSHISSTILDGKNEKSVIVCSSGENSQTVITGLTIQNGNAIGGYPDYFGGGIRCEGTSPTLSYLNIINNHSDMGGGGIYLHHSTSLIEFVKLIGNTTDNDGGGVRITSSFPILKNAIIANNYAYNRGGGVACTQFDYVGSAEIINSTIVGNSVTIATGIGNLFTGGAGVKAYGHNLKIKNTIIAFNTGDFGVSYYYYNGSEQYPYISYSLFWNNEAGDLDSCDPLCGPTITQNVNGTPTDAYLNVFANPMFKNVKTNFSLITDSPGIDAGYNEFANFPSDIFLNDRIQNNNDLEISYVNMGAIESVTDPDPVDPIEEVITNVDGEIQTSAFDFFPNPVTRELNVINKHGENFDFKIIDVYGRTLFSKQNDTTYNVLFDGVSTGIYFLVIKPRNVAENTKVYRIIKSGN